MIHFDASEKQDYFIQEALRLVEQPGGGFTNFRKAICYGGGIRSGKSYVAITTAIVLSHLYPGTRWAVVRRSIEILKLNTLPVFYKLYPQNRLQKRPTQTNNWTATFSNGSEIVFFSESFDTDKDLNRWRGLEVNGFILEEANELQYETFNKALERMGTWKMEQKWNQGGKMVYPKIILLTTNPANNWIKETFHDAHYEGTLPEEFLFIPATITDNKVLMEQQPDIVEEKRRILPDYLFKKFIEGDWEVTENDRPFITEFDEVQHVFDDLEFDDRLPVYVSMDFNVEPPAALICQHNKGFLHVIQEVDIGTGSIYDVCKYIRRNYEGFRLRLTGDASGKSREKADKDLRNLYQIACKELGLNYRFDVDAPDRNPLIHISRDLCNSVFRGYRFGYHLRIDRSCKKLLADIRNARVDRFGELEKGRGRQEVYLDYLDALRYMISTAVPDFVSVPALYV